MQNGTKIDLGQNALRLTAGLLIGFALAFFAYYGIAAISDPVFSIDFSPYYVAGQLLEHGQPDQLIPQISDGLFTTRAQPYLDNFHRYFFPDSPVGTGWIYMPGYAWLFRPFSSLDFPIAARLWLAVNMLLACAAVGLVILARPWQGASQYRLWRVAWIIFLGLTFQPILDNLWHGNISVLILFCFCLSYLLLRRGHYVFAGLVLGLIVPLKFYPALLILYFIWRRNWAFVLGALVSSFAMIALGALTTGLGGLLGYVDVIMAELRAGGVAAFNNQSIAGFLLHALTQGDVNTWAETSTPLWVTLLRYALVLLLVGAVLWTMRRRPEKLNESIAAQDFDLALIIGVMLLASPITWYHYYVWLFLPIIMVFDYLLTGALSRTRLIVFAAAYSMIAMQAFSPIRAFAPEAIQDIWVLRVLLSTSFFGAVLLIALILRLREELH